MKQDKTGHILTLSIHPDDTPEALLRDFVGARYQVVMVRLGQNEQPMNREQELPGKDLVRNAGILCRDAKFAEWLVDIGHIFDASEEAATEWLKEELQIMSRSELRENKAAADKFKYIQQEYIAWKINN